MKKNMPVTNNEVHMTEGQTLVSKTDLKGAITYANPSFIVISGFSEAELIGKNHNMVRHPDMPPAAFQDLWDTVKLGRPWSGMVKNRCKNGDFYWVKANVTPIIDNGHVTEYMSVRSKPTSDEVAATKDAYVKLKNGSLKVKGGNLLKPGLPELLAKLGNINLTSQFITLGIVVVMLSALVVLSLKQQYEQIAFSQQELIGVEYVQPIRQLLEFIPKHRGLTNAFLNGNKSFESKILRVRKNIDDLFEAALKVDQKLGASLDTSNKFSVISNEWVVLKDTAFSMEAKDSFDRHSALINKVLSLIVHAGDTSNLILDPELGSFYSMDLVINKIPALVENMGQVRGLGSGIIANDSMSQNQVIRMMELKVGIDVNYQGLLASYRSGADADERLKQRLGLLTGEVESIIGGFIEDIDVIRSGNMATLNSQKFFSSGTESINQAFALYDESAALLTDLLEERVTSMEVQFYTVSFCTILAILLALTLVVTMGRNILASINSCLSNFTELARGNFYNNITISGNNELSSVMYALKSMQIKMGFDVENAARLAGEATRIRNALDVCQANVMVADNDLNIIYMNESVQHMFNETEKALRSDLPGFDASKLLGGNADVFHKNPAHQRQMLSGLKNTYETTIVVGGRTFSLLATPVFDKTENRLGTAIEWNDRTNEVAIELEIDTLVEASANGDLSKRIDPFGKTGFFKKLATGLNQTVESTDSFLRDMGGVLSAMSDGNLTKVIHKDYQGSFGELKLDVNTTINKLTDIITRIRDSSGLVHSAANEIYQGNDDLSRRTEAQASSLEETAASMEEITSTVKESSTNASEANGMSTSAKKKAAQGGQVVKGAIEAMGEILTSSNKINDIIGVIDEIAFQTNLLALNAAVEAARAGEQGRGFAVVAGEVRTLSQRSAAAAKEIKDLIRDSMTKVESGSKLVNESGETLGEIVTAIDDVAKRVEEIANSAAEQHAGIGQINQAITQMDDMTQQNAALVEEASAASEALSEQAGVLNNLVGFFSVGGMASQVMNETFK